MCNTLDPSVSQCTKVLLMAGLIFSCLRCLSEGKPQNNELCSGRMFICVGFGMSCNQLLQIVFLLTAPAEEESYLTAHMLIAVCLNVNNYNVCMQMSVFHLNAAL